jgi:hypothetical protein
MTTREIINHNRGSRFGGYAAYRYSCLPIFSLFVYDDEFKGNVILHVYGYEEYRYTATVQTSELYNIINGTDDIAPLMDYLMENLTDMKFVKVLEYCVLSI